jgi:hypothetical protein
MFSLHFVAFLCIFGTNLLTRCHSASSYFLLFLYFRKVTQEIFSELDETKAEVPISKTESKGVMSMHVSVLVDSVGPPSIEVCRTAASFP